MRGAKRTRAGIHSRAAWLKGWFAGLIGYDGGRTRYSAIVDDGQLTEAICVSIWRLKVVSRVTLVLCVGRGFCYYESVINGHSK